MRKTYSKIFSHQFNERVMEPYCKNTYQSSACKNMFYIEYFLLCVVSEITICFQNGFIINFLQDING